MIEKAPYIEDMPGCCTSAIVFGFGEHGEDSDTTVEKINELIKTKANDRFEVIRGRQMQVANGKRCIFAISVNPHNIRTLKSMGFKVVDMYEGVQGTVRILTLHL